MALLTDAIARGTIGARPAAGSPGRVYFSTEPATYRDNGSSWDDVSDPSGGGSGSITASGYTQNTARILGRTTASAGAIEEITVGSGLSLAAGALTATGGAGLTDFATAARTAGNLTLNNGSVTDVDNGLDLTIAAATGDLIEVGASGVWGGEATSGKLFVATIVSAAVVNYITSGTSTAWDVQAWGKDAGASVYPRIAGGQPYVVQAGDISGGNVVFRLRYTSSGSLTLFGGSAPNASFRWWVKNYGAV